MYELSYANIDFLKREVSKSGITYSHLQDDLIDHLCCDVETEMNNGLPFEKAYDVVVSKIGYQGLQRIQEDTLYLIDKNYRFMKNMMRISGLISPVLMSFGALFKIMHWPAAGILLVLGFFSLCFFFLPSAMYVSFREIGNKTKKIIYYSAFFSTFFLAASFLFKVMHWPMAGILFILGMFITCFLFLPALLISKSKEQITDVPRFVYVLCFIGFLVYLLGFAFKMMHWPGAAILLISGSILFIFIALPAYTYKKYKQSNHIENSFIFIVFALLWFVMPVTLLSINVSRNLLITNVETENIYQQDINYFTQKNAILLEKSPENTNSLEIKTESEALFDLLQEIKEKISGVENIGNTGSCAEIFKGNKGKKLIEMYNQYKNDLTKANNKAASILPSSLNKDFFDVSATNAASLNSLSLLQLSILISKNLYLEGIVKKKSMTKVIN